VLLPALAPGGRPSHAYLFHGPGGTGKRRIARGFAAALVAGEEGAVDPGVVERIGERVEREAHPDVTWVRASGAQEMLVGDIEEPVIGAAARRPFEAGRRVFVIEGVERMNEQAGNRMLKTLEEPPAFVHLVLVTDRVEDVLETISSRCQRVRFDPLPPERTAERLKEGGMEPVRALASARLAMGDEGLAERLGKDEGQSLRDGAGRFIQAAVEGDTEESPWMGLLDAARRAGETAGEAADERLEARVELLPVKERKKTEREGVTEKRRVERRERTETLHEGLRLAELWLRDVLCVREGAGELIYAVDRAGELERAGMRARESAHPEHLQKAIELVTETRLSLGQNVSEELALEALAYRLQALQIL
jgi:DNA polymerase-3 subunit delta'